MHPLIRQTGGPALLALGGSALASLVLPGITVAEGFLASAAAGCAVLAIEAGRPGAGCERSALLPLVPGLLAFSTTLALPIVVTSAGVIAFSALLATALFVAGASVIAGRLIAFEHEAEDLRARLLRREGDVRVQAERIRRLDLRDPATGALNARAFDDALTDALEEMEPECGMPIALLLIELPDSAAIPAAVEAARRAVRASDIVARLDEREIAGITVPPGSPPPRPDRLLEAAGRVDDTAGAQAVWPLEWGLKKVESAT